MNPLFEYRAHLTRRQFFRHFVVGIWKTALALSILYGLLMPLFSMAAEKKPAFGKGAPNILSYHEYAIFGSMTRDGEGNLYMGENQSRVIYRIDRSGKETLWVNALYTRPLVLEVKDGPRLQTRIKDLWDIACDPQGNLLFLDAGVLRRVGTNGMVTTVVNLAPAKGDIPLTVRPQAREFVTVFRKEASSGISPVKIAVDGRGNIFALENHSAVILQIDPKGKTTLFAGIGKEFGEVGFGLAIDLDGNVSVSTVKGIVNINSDGKPRLLIPRESKPQQEDGWDDVDGMRYDKTGNLWVQGAQSMTVISPAGKRVSVAAWGGQTFCYGENDDFYVSRGREVRLVPGDVVRKTLSPITKSPPAGK